MYPQSLQHFPFSPSPRRYYTVYTAAFKFLQDFAGRELSPIFRSSNEKFGGKLAGFRILPRSEKTFTWTSGPGKWQGIPKRSVLWGVPFFDL